MIKIWNNEKVDWRIKFKSDGEEASDFLSVSTEISEGTQVLYIGLGKSSELTTEKLSRAAAKAVKTLRELGAGSALFDADTYEIAALAQGAALAEHGQEKFSSESKRSELKIYIKASEREKAERALAQAYPLINAICFARDLVNHPANKLTPGLMAQRMKEAAERVGAEVQIIDAAEAKMLNMEAFLTVGTSASHSPYLIVLRYRGGKPEQAPIALVGKGVTCDTGGYCVKPGDSMLGIKGDMAGGAAVCGALLALAENKIPINVTAIIPAVENRISPDSFIPGDVIGSMSGKTIEIINTDAEGRLILADAITYAIRCEGAEKVVDIATLTGAVVNMFGFTTAGYLTNDEKLNDAFMAAYGRSGEQYWRLPIFPEYREMNSSAIADIANSSHGGCGTITAGLFIGAFAEEKPWLHIDIAGTAWVDSPKREYQNKGATGAGVSTLYELCRGLANE